MVKQVDSRTGQNFDEAVYALLPDVINEPDYIYQDNNNYTLIKDYKEDFLLSVVKYIPKTNELFMQSYRLSNDKQLARLEKTLKRLK